MDENSRPAYLRAYLNYLIVEKRISKKEMEEKTGVSRTTIHNLISGKPDYIRDATFNAVLGMFPEYLKEFEGKKEAVIDANSQSHEVTALKKIIAEMKEKFALSKELTEILKEKVFAMKDKMDLLEAENERLKEEIKRLKSE